MEDEKLAGKREPPRCPPLLLAASEDETTGATRFANTLLKTAGAKSLEDLAELLHKTGNPVDAMRLALAGVAESAAALHAQKREKTRARAEELLQSAQEAPKMASEDALGNRMRALEAERAARKAEELARSKGKLAEEVLQKAAQTARATQECLQELAQACGTKKTVADQLAKASQDLLDGFARLLLPVSEKNVYMASAQDLSEELCAT